MEGQRLDLAVPHRGAQKAQLKVYEVRDWSTGLSTEIRMRNKIIVVASAIGALASSAVILVAAGYEQASAKPDTSRPPTVLFICPHGAAKSVLASAYFQRVAKERGLNVRVLTAGTEPDAEVSAAVASHLTTNGYPLPVTKPRRVAPEDLATADVVISIGCDLRQLPAPRGTLVQWDDVPGPGEDFAGADEAIRKRVMALVDELIRQRQKR